ncbi:MAG TPA: BlaI/MecI/CopY family transcriptional regulator [Pyrinomonadaceae bacterium]|nr:BlaI/MecI/CopY family transcriptional regulator [Pyrinomonadaceae bacterium]
MKRIKPKITLRGFTPGKRGTAQVLGELQTAVMEILWSESPLAVTEVEQKLQKNREIAHTTVLTTLDRMHGNNLLLREKQGKAYVYSPRYSQAEFERGVAQEVLSGLLTQFAEPALSAFVELVGEDGEKLDQLEELIRLKRERMENGEK